MSISLNPKIALGALYLIYTTLNLSRAETVYGSKPNHTQKLKCVIYIKHEFPLDSKLTRTLANRTDEFLLHSVPMGLAQPFNKNSSLCNASFERYMPGTKLRTGEKELAIVRWTGPTKRAKVEFTLWYYVYDTPQNRRIRNTGGFPLPKVGYSPEEIEKIAKSVADIVIIGANT